MALVDNAWYVNFGDGSTTGYYAVTAWAALTTKVCGNLVRQLAAPAVGSERVFVCIASTGGVGVTSAAEIAWTLTRGAKNTDTATITWQECTGIAALNGDLSTNTPNWTTVKNTVVTLGQVIQSNDGTKVLICSTGGTAGNGAEPTWATYTTAGATTADNTATWTTIAAVPSGFSAWAAPHARCANAFAATWGQAGNKFFVADNSAETQTTALTFQPPGTAATLSFVYCVDHTVSVPPGSANLLTTATVTSTLASASTAVGIKGYFYCYGIIFQATGNGGQLGSPSSIAGYWFLDSCKFVLGGNSTNLIFLGENTQTCKQILNNTTMKFGNVGQSIGLQISQEVRWQNTPSAIDGTGSSPTTLFKGQGNQAGSLVCDGVDLNNLGANTLVGAFSQMQSILFKDCKLPASVTVTLTPTDPGGHRVDLVCCDNGATNYRTERYRYEGTQTIETTIVRTGGATDGTTVIAWKIITTANSKWVLPFESLPITIWNDTTGSPITVTIFGIWGTGAVPNNDDIWIDVEFLGAAGAPLGSFSNSTKSNNLAMGSALSSDSSTWGGSTTPFKMSVTFTPQMKGPINLVVKAAKPSTTFYIDPKPSISGVTVSKSEILAPGVYANELSSGGPVGQQSM